MACEFLILNSVRIDAVDAHGNSALHMAAKQGNTGQVERDKAPKDLTNEHLFNQKHRKNCKCCPYHSFNDALKYQESCI